MITLLRWLGVIVLPLIAGVSVIICVQLMLNYFNAQCDQTMSVAGLCVASWHADAMDAIVHGGLALIAAGTVMLPGIVAPALRRWLSLAGLVLVTSISFFVYQRFGWPDLLGAAVVMTATGLLCFGYIWFRETSAHDN